MVHIKPLLNKQKSYIKANGALKKRHTNRKKIIKWNKKPTEGKCVFLCIFDHWALFAQTVFCLRAAAVVLHVGQGCGDTMRQIPRRVGILAKAVWTGTETEKDRVAMLPLRSQYVYKTSNV